MKRITKICFTMLMVSGVGFAGAMELERAIEKGDVAEVKRLVEQRANVNSVTSARSEAPLIKALKVPEPKCMPILKLLIAHKADVNTPDPAGYSPLRLASYRSTQKAHKLLLEHKASL